MLSAEETGPLETKRRAVTWPVSAFWPYARVGGFDTLEPGTPVASAATGAEQPVTVVTKNRGLRDFKPLVIQAYVQHLARSPGGGDSRGPPRGGRAAPVRGLPAPRARRLGGVAARAPLVRLRPAGAPVGERAMRTALLWKHAPHAPPPALEPLPTLALTAGRNDLRIAVDALNRECGDALTASTQAIPKFSVHGFRWAWAMLEPAFLDGRAVAMQELLQAYLAALPTSLLREEGPAALIVLLGRAAPATAGVQVRR